MANSRPPGRRTRCSSCSARAPLGADEGYLWFGVQQLLKGRVPHRDFRSYEPGRYLWAGLWARVFGNGLHVLRASTHLFFAFALAVALLALRRLELGWLPVACAAMALAALSHPQHKQFEHGFVLLSWSALTHVLLSPTPPALAAAAGLVGIALFFGVNLFLYCGAALALVLAGAVVADIVALDATTVGTLLGAGLLGLLPFALLLPLGGFARTFYRRRVATVLTRGESNLSLPCPWPWREVPRHLKNLRAPHQRAFQWAFLALAALPVVAGVLALTVVTAPMSLGMLAACAMGLVFFHHAVSRADAPHITQSLGPVCLLAILGAEAVAPIVAVAVAALAIALVWPLQPWVQRRARPADFCRRSIAGFAIDVRRGEARILDAASALCAHHAGNRAGFFAAPAYPALYSQLERDAPAYDTFSLYPADARAQQEMIDGIERAQVFAALVSDAPVDGREELRFSRTHAQVWAHLHANFNCERRRDLGGDVFVLTRAC